MQKKIKIPGSYMYGFVELMAQRAADEDCIEWEEVTVHDLLAYLEDYKESEFMFEKE